MSRRTERLNSLLKEVISEVIQRDVRHPGVHPLTSITRVEIASDLSEAKVHISILGTTAEKATTVESLNRSHGFIQVAASKKMVIRHFPVLRFFLDETVETQIRMHEIMHGIQKERDARDPSSS